MRLIESERKQIIELFYKGNSRKEIGEIVHHSSATVQHVVKAHERNVREHGLIYELSEEGLTEPLELARLYGELQRAGVSVTDCREAVPIVRKCKEVNLEEGRVDDLIEAAVTLGEPEFPRQEFTESLLRILRQERETGQTIEQLESAHRQLSSDIQKLQSDRDTLRTSIRQLNARKTHVETDLQNVQLTLTGLQSRLDRVPVTESQLATYIADKRFLATVGLDISETGRGKDVLLQIVGLNHDPAAIVRELSRIGDLNVSIQTLTKNIYDLQSSVATLTQQRDSLGGNIRDLEKKREQVRENVRRELDDAYKRILDSKAKVIEQLAREKVTEQELADFRAARAALVNGGVPL